MSPANILWLSDNYHTCDAMHKCGICRRKVSPDDFVTDTIDSVYKVELYFLASVYKAL